MRYRRSGTEMDRASLFTPQSLLGRSRLRGLGWPQPPEGYEWGPFDELVPIGSTGAQNDGWNWQRLVKDVPTILKDLYIADKTGEAQIKLLEINMERAQRGLPPITSDSVAPAVKFGVDEKVLKTGLIAAGVLAAGLFLSGALKRR